MSAFMVPVEHIRAMVNAGLEAPLGALSWSGGEGHRRRQLTLATAEEVGQMLLAENRRSVNYRYDQRKKSGKYTHASSSRRSTVEILKAIASYEYQSCETPDWFESEAYRFCQALHYAMVRHIPGWDEAAWVIDKR